jgi:hypothetical protein
MVSSLMLRRVALVRTDVLEEPSTSFIRVTRIGELLTTLAATSNRRTLRSISSQRGARFLRNVGLTRATQRNIPQDTIRHSHSRETSNLTEPFWDLKSLPIH